MYVYLYCNIDRFYLYLFICSFIACVYRVTDIDFYMHFT